MTKIIYIQDDASAIMDGIKFEDLWVAEAYLRAKYDSFDVEILYDTKVDSNVEYIFNPKDDVRSML